MNQKLANKIFETDLGRQLYVIYVTSDDQPFIRRQEAENYCKNTLKEGDDITKYNIVEWYPE